MEIHSCSPPQTSATLCPRNTVCKAYWSPDKTAGSFPFHGSTFMTLRVEPSTLLQQWSRLRYCCCNFAWRILLLPVKTDMHFIIASTFTLKGHWDAADHSTVWLQFITTSFQYWPKRDIKEQYSTTSSKPIFTYCKFKFAAFSIKLWHLRGYLTFGKQEIPRYCLSYRFSAGKHWMQVLNLVFSWVPRLERHYFIKGASIWCFNSASQENNIVGLK